MALDDLLCISKSHLYDLRQQGLRSLSDVPKVAESAVCAASGEQPTAQGLSQPGGGCVKTWTVHQTFALTVWETVTPHPRAGCVSGICTCYICDSTSLYEGAELLQKWEISWCCRTKAAAASYKHLFSAETRLHCSLH